MPEPLALVRPPESNRPASAPAGLADALEAHDRLRRPRLERYWSYYRNEDEHPAAAPGFIARDRHAARAAQESGLPSRVTGDRHSADPLAPARREVVIENDIAWRVHAMVDFMFGKPVPILATGASLEDDQRRRIELVLDRVWEASGGIALLQDMALLGHVYGHVDLAVRVDQQALDLVARGASAEPTEADLIAAAEAIRIEVIEPTRGVAVLDPADYRRMTAYAIALGDPGETEHDAVLSTARAPGRVARLLGRQRPAASRNPRRGYLEVLTATARRVEVDGRVTSERLTWTGGVVPVVHIQNVAQPFRYEGLGEVEPLIALQDELNTRLSDRASRVTMQSFKMYLAKGLEGFDRVPVAPGTVWTTDNPDASVEAFGGDADSPSEESHIQQIREALDKISAVPPLASGVVRARVGNLTSANALRITLMGLLSKTARKRVTYGRGIAGASAMALGALDHAGVLATTPAQRTVKLDWPDPLPVDLRERAAEARTKLELGVEREDVLRSLGLTRDDPGVR